MRNSRLDRILYIQQVLVQGGVLNKQQTADRFGVSEKTIQRDLDTLRNHFADSEPRRRGFPAQIVKKVSPFFDKQKKQCYGAVPQHCFSSYHAFRPQRAI